MNFLLVCNSKSLKLFKLYSRFKFLANRKSQKRIRAKRFCVKTEIYLLNIKVYLKILNSKINNGNVLAVNYFEFFSAACFYHNLSNFSAEMRCRNAEMRTQAITYFDLT